MPREVPLGRRNLLSDRRRVAVSVLGVGLAVALMLLIQGLWSGTLARITAYEDRSGVQLFVAERGTRSFQSDVSSVPPEAAPAIRRVPGVRSADPILARGLILDLHGSMMPATLIGSRVGGLGGPWSLEAGRTVATDGEIVVDAGMAADHGYGIGDTFEVVGSELRIVGLAPDTRALGSAGLLFVSQSSAGRIVGEADPSFVLVRTDDPTVADRIATRTGLAVLTAGQMAGGDRELYDDTLGSVVRMMLAIAFAAGTLIVALSVYSAVVERIREYGIVKALGATPGRLFAIVAAQTGILASIGAGVGLAVFGATKAALGAWLPEFHVVLPGSVLVAAFLAVAAMALVAAVLPARRIGRLDPASVYRG